VRDEANEIVESHPTARTLRLHLGCRASRVQRSVLEKRPLRSSSFSHQQHLGGSERWLQGATQHWQQSGATTFGTEHPALGEEAVSGTPGSPPSQPTPGWLFFCSKAASAEPHFHIELIPAEASGRFPTRASLASAEWRTGFRHASSRVSMFVRLSRASVFCRNATSEPSHRASPTHLASSASSLGRPHANEESFPVCSGTRAVELFERFLFLLIPASP
jgi:hypothetical protein